MLRLNNKTKLLYENNSNPRMSLQLIITTIMNTNHNFTLGLIGIQCGLMNIEKRSRIHYLINDGTYQGIH